MGLVNRIVRAADIAIMFISAMLLLSHGLWLLPALTAMQAFWIAVLDVAVFSYVLRHFEAYRVENYVAVWPCTGMLTLGLGVTWVVDGIYLSAFRSPEIATMASLAAVHVPQFGFLLVGRLGARALWRKVRSLALVRRNVVLVGANPTGEAVLRRLLDPTQTERFNVAGVFADRTDGVHDGTLLDRTVLGDVDLLGSYVQSNAIDLVIVALPLPRAAETVAMIEELQWMATDVVIPFEEIGIQPSFARLANIAGVSTLQVLHRPLNGSQALLKIIEDYVVASAATVLLTPLMLLVALAIRLDSKGPALFKQERTGFNNNNFYIYKFRTMHVDPSDDGSVGTTDRRDPRITRVGRFLRRYSIDEFPQLLNVLRGEMSVVGPRPYVPNMLVGGSRTFRDAVHNYAVRYRLKPGITGLAQSSGLRSNALRTLANAQRSIELDLEYIANWSLWLDFRIMLRTVFMSMYGRDVF